MKKKNKLSYPIFSVIIGQVFGTINILFQAREWAFFWMSVSWFMIGICFIIKAIEDK